jgi:hypothetical protein
MDTILPEQCGITRVPQEQGEDGAQKSQFYPTLIHILFCSYPFYRDEERY